MTRGKICAVVGAGDYIGAAIAKKFAREGYEVFAGRRRGDQLAPLKAAIEKEGGTCHALTLDARSQESLTDFFQKIDEVGELEICIFNIGGNVYFPFLETTERVYRKVWELCAQSAFLTAQATIPRLLKRGSGSLFFTSATSSVVSNIGYSAFASGKFALRALSQSIAREFGPQNIHIVHLIIDAGVDTAWVRGRIAEARGQEAVDNLVPDQLVNPDHIADTYFYLHNQPRDCWTYEMDLRPFMENIMKS
jgi:NAD(P)-dependent dehydrogenase (short-subunit alcohol dehydrogenase family)